MTSKMAHSARVASLWKQYCWTARALPERVRRREIRLARTYVRNIEQEAKRVAAIRYQLRVVEQTIQFIKYRAIKRKYDL